MLRWRLPGIGHLVRAVILKLRSRPVGTGVQEAMLSFLRFIRRRLLGHGSSGIVPGTTNPPSPQHMEIMMDRRFTTTAGRPATPGKPGTPGKPEHMRKPENHGPSSTGPAGHGAP